MEAADTQDVMTCRKYGWSAGDSTALFYAGKHAAQLQQQQQQQQQQQVIEDALTSADGTDEQRRQNR